MSAFLSFLIAFVLVFIPLFIPLFVLAPLWVPNFVALFLRGEKLRADEWDLLEHLMDAESNEVWDRHRMATGGRSTLHSRHPLALRWTLARRLTWVARRGDDFYDERLRRVDSDPDHGALYCFHNRRGSQGVLIVTCPSKGTKHVLFVPEHLRSAKAARAWTFGMSEAEFSPSSET